MDALMNWKMITSPTLQKNQTCDAAIGIFKTGKNLSRNQERCFILVRNTSQTRETDLNPHLQNFKILKNGGG